MLHALADARRAEFGEDLVEALAAEIESLCIGAVAQAEYAVDDARQAEMAEGSW